MNVERRKMNFDQSKSKHIATRTSESMVSISRLRNRGKQRKEYSRKYSSATRSTIKEY